ncbi:MAG TPA: prepilin-type N-terminal cleavage/methylation domain-containing protein [Desulfobacteraceae bacterium]|jgi:type IV pilus assembly protein PilV|nr:prepilin-type N-terminal cleavage/methylation domain-containing protein [Desulfobacteraceae bacterium]
MKSQEGFTLLEVIIAISILAVGLLAVAAMQDSAMKATVEAYNTTERTIRAQDRMELLLSLPYKDSMLLAGSHSDASAPPGYTITWNVDEDDPVTNSKKVTVFVSRQDRNRTRSTSIACMKPRL